MSLWKKSAMKASICSRYLERVRVDMSSPSCKEDQQRHYRKSNGSRTYAFDFCQLLPRGKVRQKGILSKSCREDTPALVERNASSSIDWLDCMLRLKCRLVWRFVCHHARIRAAGAADSWRCCFVDRGAGEKKILG